MFKTNMMTTALCLVLGIGVLHAFSGGPTPDGDTATATQVELQPAADDARCLAEVGLDTSAPAGLDDGAGYECPANTGYCRRDSDCDQSNGEVCERGCCLAAW